MLDDKQGVAESVNNTIGLNINQDTDHKNWGQWTCLGAGSQGCDGIKPFSSDHQSNLVNMCMTNIQKTNNTSVG